MQCFQRLSGTNSLLCIKRATSALLWHPDSSKAFHISLSQDINNLHSAKFPGFRTMATSSKIVLTPAITGEFSVRGLTEGSAAKASEVLQENHEKHHIFYNKDGFHSRFDFGSYFNSKGWLFNAGSNWFASSRVAMLSLIYAPLQSVGVL